VDALGSWQRYLERATSHGDDLFSDPVILDIVAQVATEVGIVRKTEPGLSRAKRNLTQGRRLIAERMTEVRVLRSGRERLPLGRSGLHVELSPRTSEAVPFGLYARVE
jgi:hypothetical protein